MTDIKERISKLIDDGPDTDPAVGHIARAVHDNWYRWREALIDRLAKDSNVLKGHLYDGKHFCAEWKIPDSDDDDDIKLNATCIALDFQPIRKGVTKDEITKALRTVYDSLKNQYPMNALVFDELADRIDQEGITND